MKALEPGGQLRRCVVTEALEDDDELVAAEAREVMATAEPALQAAGEFREHVIGSGESERMPDLSDMLEGDQPEPGTIGAACGCGIC